MTVAVRPLEQGDRKFVISTWLDSYRTSFSAGLVPFDRWYDVMWPIVDRLLDRPGVRTLVSHETEERDRLADLYGFITFELDTPPTDKMRRGGWSKNVPTVYYVYVKGPQRKWGYARQLFAAAGVDPRYPFVQGCRTEICARLGNKIPLSEWDQLRARIYPDERRPEK